MSSPEVFVVKQEIKSEPSDDEPMIVASIYADDSDEDIAEEVGEVLAGAEDASTTSPAGARSRAPCPTCHKVLANRTTLLKHIRIHTDERPYPCPLCQRRFRQKEHRDKHTRIHSMGNSFECVECSMAFGRRHFLVKHMRAVHNVDLITGLVNNAIRLGDASEHPQIEVPVEADTTAATAAVPAPEPAPAVLYRCHVCRKEFNQRHNLRRHVRSQHSKESTECHFCGKVFKRMSGLKTHELTHSGQRPYLCSTCGRTFSQKHHMMRHQLVHVPKFNIVCSICQTGFRYASSFFEHMAIHDAADQQRDEERSQEGTEVKPEVKEELKEEMKAQQQEDGKDSPNQGNEAPDHFEVVTISEDAHAQVVATVPDAFRVPDGRVPARGAGRTPTAPLLREEYVAIEDLDVACMFCDKMIVDPCELTEHLLEHCHELSGGIEADENNAEDEVDEILGL